MNDLTIQTAADFLDEYLGQEAKIHHNRDRSGIAYADHHCEKVMIEFAKMHVEAALKAAAEKADITYTGEKTWDFIFVDKTA